MTFRCPRCVRRGWAGLVALAFLCAVPTASHAADDPYATLLNTAGVLIDSGRLDAARQTLDAAIVLSPARYEAYRLAGIVEQHAGREAEARSRWSKALELAPIAAQPELVKLLGTLRGAAGGAAPTADEQRELDALTLIIQEIGAAADNDARLRLSLEFLTRSAAFGRAHPQQTVLWVARAEAAVELHRPAEAREAGQLIVRIESPDANTRRLLAMLERNGWTQPLSIRTVLPAGPAAPAAMVGRTVKPGATDLKLLWVAPGSFRLGTTAVEKRGVRATITRGYWLGRTEVTQAQWQDVMGTNPSNFQQLGNPANRMAWSGDSSEQPVEQVAWRDADEFCRRLTAIERDAGRLPDGYEYRLPTEVEWEMACRAGTTGDYYGDLDRIAWFDRNSHDATHDVAGKKANAWGFFDMSGNVAEWCYDWYADFDGTDVTDRAILDPNPDLPSGRTRIIRGGAWIHVAPRCESAYRLFDDPNTSLSYVGFRVALAPAIRR